MNRYFLISIFLLALFSCKKSSKDAVSESYPVSFKVGNVYTDLPETKGASTFASADSSLNKYGVLYYLVFDATGKFVHQIKQVKGDALFGTIADQLKVGQYTIVLLSSTGDMAVGTTLVSLVSTKVKSTAASGDIFYKKLAVNVTAEGVSQSIVLDRIVGCVEMRITDKIADNIARIELQVENETPYFSLGTDNVETANVEVRSVSSDLTAANRNSFKLALLILNDQLPLTATVKLLDAANAVVKTKKITGIQNLRRKKVVLAGKVSDFMSAGFSIGYDENWSSDSTVVNF